LRLFVKKMAIITKMRNSGWVLIIIIGALVLFVISDLISGFQKGGGSQDPIVGEFDGTELKYSEYDELYKRREANKIQQNNGTPLSPTEMELVANETWEDFFRKIVINAEYEKLGLKVGVKELEKLLFSDNMHPYLIEYQRFFTDGTNPISGASMVSWYKQVYKTNPEAQLFFNELKAAIVSNVQGDKYKTLVEKGLYVTTFEAQQDFFEYSKTLDGNLVAARIANVKDEEISFDDKDLKNYYQKNKKDFKQEELRDIEFVSWAIVPTPEDSLAALESAKREVENFVESDNDSSFVAYNSERPLAAELRGRGDFSAEIDNVVFSAEEGTVHGPFLNNGAYSIFKVNKVVVDSQYRIKFSHMFIPKRWENKTDSLAIVAEAKTYVEMAKVDFSSLETIVNEKGYMLYGDKGKQPWMEQAAVEERISKAVVRASKDQVLMLNSAQGIDIIKIDENATNKRVSVMEVAKLIEPTMSTINSYYIQASEFRASLDNGKNGAFEKAIEKAKLAKRVARDLKIADREVPGLGDAREILRWAFDEKTKQNDVSEVFTIGNRQIVVHVSTLKAEGIAKFEQVKEQVIEKVKAEKKLDLLEQRFVENMKTMKANDMVDLAIKMKTVAQPITRLNFKTDNLPEARDEYYVVGSLFGLEANKVSKPIRGKEAIYVALINKVEIPKDVPQNLESRKAFVNQNVMQVLETKIMSSLKNNVEIVDNRGKFY
jgi:peptidyl-prolyl cis-trans isomerase D